METATCVHRTVQLELQFFLANAKKAIICFCFGFRGTVSVDISLKYVDINQCDAQDSNGLEEQKETGNKQTRLNTFMGTHRCKQSTKASQSKDHNINSH